MKQNATDGASSKQHTELTNHARLEERQYNVHEYHLFAIVTIFLVSFLGFFSIPEAGLPNLDRVYVEMAVFLFAIVSSFVIARQNTRYRQIMREIARFDGGMTAIYRELYYFGSEAQDRFAEIARKHYEPVIANHEWDYNICHPCNTLQQTYHLLENLSDQKNFDANDGTSLANIKKQLAEMQKCRKNIVLLHAERIPRFQWFVVVFLSFILLMTISSIGSYGQYIESIIKASFATAIITTIVMMRRLDDLQLFESFLGEHSAEDVMSVINEKK